MPYSSTKSLPSAAKNLPEAAKKIWLSAFNAASKSGKYTEEQAFAIAMAAVKNRYKQVQGKWVAKTDSEPLLPLSDEEFPLEVKSMPAAAKSIFKAAFRKARKEKPDSLAAILALTAVKKHFTRIEGEEGEEWVKKEEAESAREEEIASILAAVESAGGNEGEGEGDDEGGGEGGGGGGSESADPKKKRTGETAEPGYTKTTKTTETTESRAAGATDSIQLTEMFTLDADTSKRFGMHVTPNGYLVAEPRVARTGIQLYKGFEVGLPNIDVIRIYRPDAEVFDKRAMASLAHRPITLDHPNESVDPSNWKKYAVGHSTGDIARDGEFIRVPLTLMDATAINAVKSGTTQLSVGYGAKLVWGQGETSDGQLYDAMQTDIRANHIALVRAARGGDKLRMGDSHERRKPMTERTLNLDGVNIALEDKDGQILERHLKTLNDSTADLRKLLTDAQAEKVSLDAKVAELTKSVGLKDGEIEALKQKLEDNKITPQKVDEEINIRMDVVDRATSFFSDTKYVWKGKSNEQIRRDVVAARMGDQRAKAMDDPRVEGAFLSITDQPGEQDGFRRMADSFSGRPANGGYNDKAAAAYDKRNEELSTRWMRNKGKAASV
jgi:cation transport regulator ChaB